MYKKKLLPGTGAPNLPLLRSERQTSVFLVVGLEVVNIDNTGAGGPLAPPRERHDDIFSADGEVLVLADVLKPVSDLNLC